MTDKEINNKCDGAICPHYRQCVLLKRKEQECEELKAFKAKITKPIILSGTPETEIINKLDSYKQALEKIEEIAEISNNPPCLEFDCDCTQCEDETTDNGSTCMQYGLERILDIINEVKDE